MAISIEDAERGSPLTMKDRRKEHSLAPSLREVSYCELVFGHADRVRKILVDAVTVKRKALGLSCRQVDRLCFFGSTLPKRGLRIPTCAEFEADPSKMNGFVFSLAEGPLNLRLDRVLKLESALKSKLTRKQIHGVIEEMRSRGRGVAAGAGGTDVKNVPWSKQVALYLLFRMMNELSFGNGAAAALQR